MRKIRLNIMFLIVAIAVAPKIYAQNPDAKKPIEVTAQESLEWFRNDHYFVAKKDVRASQGETTLHAATLTAKYAETETSNIDIHTITAEENVRIIAQDSQVFGDYAIYDVKKGYAKMTGSDLKLISEDQTVTANNRFEYWVNDGRLEAHGNAVAVREGDKLTSDQMIATFTERDGKRTLKTLEAIGNVVITTPDEVLKGERAIYNANTDIAELKDNVFITRGPNTLQGARAQVNLATNVSKMFGGTSASVSPSATTESGTGRVRAVFYPESKEDGNTPTQ
ncbi:MAG: ostA-like family protein [Alphaproteobacteria bacterium]|nr:ostA-like family protein [Alphaproteobacteria bacterium]